MNSCINAIHAGNVDADPAKWLVTQEVLEQEIAKVKKAKAEQPGDPCFIPVLLTVPIFTPDMTLTTHHTVPCTRGCGFDLDGPLNQPAARLE